MRMTVNDREKVDRVMNDPSIWPLITDDGSPERFESEAVLACDAIYIFMPNEFSVYIAKPWNTITYELHANVIAGHRGDIALKAGLSILEYMFTQTACEKVISLIPDCFPNVKAYVEKGGYQEEGLVKDGVKRGGVLYNIHIMGLTKKQWQK